MTSSTKTANADIARMQGDIAKLYAWFHRFALDLEEGTIDDYPTLATDALAAIRSLEVAVAELAGRNAEDTAAVTS